MINILEYKRTLTIFGAVMSAASGACWGYVFACKELEDNFDATLSAILDEEIEKTRRFYAIRYKDRDVEDVSELPADVVVDTTNIVIPKEALTTPEGRAAVMAEMAKVIEDKPEPVHEPRNPINVFDVDIKELIESRSGEKPYIVSKEEYERNEALYECFDLTFFEADGVLIDEQDDPIPDTEGVVGDKHLQMFGVMSEDNNIVYIQNDRVESLFRINRDPGSATEHLFGVSDEDELAHTSMKRRRPRREDE